jgi:UDP-glucuronate decarboxylase
MRILVTGGAGFLGSHLCEKLLQLNHEVLCLDNFYTSRKENIAHLLHNKKFELIYHDVTFPIYLESDGIFNLASPASPIHYQKDPVQTLKTSILGSINLLELAKITKVRILQASTSEIYGDPKISPQVENYWGNVNPIGPRSCYDEGKRAAETLFFDYHRQYSLDIRIARIFNTYGPNMQKDDGRVVSNFIDQALNDAPITIYGDGSQVRSFCYVDDLIKGLIQLFFTDKVFEPVNLGNPEPITVNELSSEILKLTNSKSQVNHFPLPKDDPLTREPDITKAKALLNWSPEISRNVGLKKTISYFEGLIANERS